jgi:hypothetical protein
MGTLATSLITTVILSSKATRVISNIGTDLVLSTISNTTYSMGQMISYFTTNNQYGIDKVVDTLNDIDLEFTIVIIDELIKELSNKELTNSVKKAIIGVNEILEIIHKELDNIKLAIEYHKTKFFCNWRALSYDHQCFNLIKKHNNILKHRYQILIELLTIYNPKSQ